MSAWKPLVIGAVASGIAQSALHPILGSFVGTVAFAIGLLAGMRSERARMLSEIEKARQL